MKNSAKWFFINYNYNYNLDSVNLNSEEIKLNKENMLFIQINANIEMVFSKYDIPYPKYIFVNRDYKEKHLMKITVIRGNVGNKKSAVKWFLSEIYVKDELTHAAIANSDDEFGYKIEII